METTQPHESDSENSVKTETRFEIDKSMNFVDCELEKSANLPVINLKTNNSAVVSRSPENLKFHDAHFENYAEINSQQVETNCTLGAEEKETKKCEELNDSLVVKIEETGDYACKKDHAGVDERETMGGARDRHESVVPGIKEMIREEVEIIEVEPSVPKSQSLIVDSDLPQIINDNEFMEHNEIVEATSQNSLVQETIEIDDEKKNESTDAAESIAPLTHTESEQNLGKSKEIVDCVATEHKTDSLNEKTIEETEDKKPITSLAFLAFAYDNSDSENDEPQCVYDKLSGASEPREMEVQITKEYRNKVATSDEESDSDSSETSTSSTSEAESEDGDEINKSCKTKNQRNKYKSAQEKEMKGEYDDLPPIEELKISVPEVLCDPLGEVGWMVDQLVVVKPKPGKPTLNLDTILFVERGRRVLGRIFDVFGQVSEPHYCVRFNSTEHIKASDIRVGMIVYFCPNTEYTSVVFLQDLLKMKAIDEIGDDENPEFSDDEEERAYYAALKQKPKNDKTKTDDAPQKRQRTDGQDSSWKSNHPWNTGSKQQGKKSGKTYKTPERSVHQQPSGCQPTNLWQYQSSYPNNSQWQNLESRRANSWQTAHPRNPYEFNEQFDNRHWQGNPRQFFRPPHAPPADSSYVQNQHYQTQTNSPRFPAANFSWQPQTPRQLGPTWYLHPPPPPPPGI